VVAERLRAWATSACRRGSESVDAMGDAVFVGIPFVFLGLCLLYVRAASRLGG